jgi:CRISPR/Cas system-associated exonuclease Cas4 (RecB family)
MNETKTQINFPLSEAIGASQREWLNEKIHRSRWSSIRASGIDDPCNRRLYYYITAGELANEITPDLVAIFEEGKEQEPGVRRYLSELGFEIKKAGFTESWDQYNIRGSVDGTLEHNGQKYIVEIKTVSEFAWDKVKSADDMKEGYFRKWFGQMQVYLLLFGYEKGVFILKRKQAKQIRVIEVDLDYDYAEKLLKKAEAVNLAIKTATPPDFIKNPVECKKCPFYGTVCQPPMDFGDAIVNIDDEEVAAKLSLRETLKPYASEYDHLDKELKERFREIPDAICGEFHVTSKKGVRTYKAAEARTVETWTTKIERLTKGEGE